MHLSFLTHLRCPAPAAAEGPRCGGRLDERSEALPARPAADDPGELLEGEVVCARCASRYPVLGGVLILVPRPERYLGRRFLSFMPFSSLHADLSRAALAWIEGKNLHRYEISPVRDRPDSFAVLHYERAVRLFDEVAIPASFRAFLAEWDGAGPHDVLAGMAERGDRSGRRLAVDVGCGVGGLVQRLADRYDAVLGVDTSFSSVLVARSILRHRPRPYRHAVHGARDVLAPKDLDGAARPNVELLVADCTALPFADRSLDAVANANVLEMVEPRALLDEAERVLSAHGLLLLTDPFKFRVGDLPSPTGDRLEDARSDLRERGLWPVEERDYVPWIWYCYQRQCQIFFNYCGAWSRTANT